VGQLVIQEVECRCRKRDIGSGCVTYCSLLCKKKNVIVAPQLYDVADVQFTEWTE